MSESQYKFGEFEVDSASFELRRQGRTQKLERVPLERIPMELLILLLERQGCVVTRQEIVGRLWGKDVFVDTDHGINTAIRKVRQALKDDPDNPRFVQTVSGKGYRFVAEKNGQAPQAAVLALPPEAPQPMWGQPPRLSGGAEVPRRSPSAGPTSKTKMRVVVAALCFAAAAAALAFQFRDRLFPGSRTRQIHSIAVIPLSNLSGDASQEYFADGMTDELITALAKNRNLRVVSRTSAMQYKGVKRPLPEIARELGVDGILEGSIERSANRVHMTVQLIYAPTDSHLWAQSYNRDETEALSLPEDLAQVVAKEVKVATSAVPAPRYINPEAHDAYLRGRYIWYGQNNQDSRSYFEKAIALQPDYALAWSGLGDSYGIQAIDGFAPAREVMAQNEAAARKAVQLDDSLPDAHVSLAAWYFFFGWDLPRALTEADRAVTLDPNYADGHLIREHILVAMNRPDEAIREQKRYMELEPFVRPWALGYAYFHLRQLDDAIAELRMRAQARPTDVFTRFLLSNCYWLKGMWKESEQEMEQGLTLSGNPKKAAAVHRAFERDGEKGVERWGVDDLKSLARHQYVSPFDIAAAYTFLGDKEQALKFLEDAYREHSPDLIFLQNEPNFDALHSDPRYQALVKKIGLQLVVP